MRILHVDTGRELRGGQRQLLLLMRGLADRGHEQRLLGRAGTLGHRDGNRAGLGSVLREAGWAEIVHAHDARGHTLAALAGRGRPLVVSRRVAFALKDSALSRWKYSRASVFLAVSEFVKGLLLLAGIPEARVEVVYDGLTLPASAPDLDSVGQMARVLAARIDDPLKGRETYLAACLLAGVAPDFSENLEKDLRPGDVFVYLSESEGFGSALLVAAARGAAVIASRVGGIPEVVEHQRTGLLTGNSPDEIAGQIRRLLDDAELRRSLASAAWSQLETRFRDTIMIRRTEQVYERLLRGSG